MKKVDKNTLENIIALFRSDTYTVVEVCRIVGISTRTFYLWQKDNQEFAQAIQDAKEELKQRIICEAKRSLLRKVKGCITIEKKTITITSKEVDGNGHPKSQIKRYIIIEKHIPPDLTAIIFALTNLDPNNWRNKFSNEVTNGDDKNLIPARHLTKKEVSDLELDNLIAEFERKLGKK